MKQKIILILLILLTSISIVGYLSKNRQKTTNSFVDTTINELVYEETLSPNKKYVQSEKDIVNYTIQIHQNKNNDIIVNADSNSDFFNKIQYILEYDKPISKTDVMIQWTTLMGNTEPTKENQLVNANISISSDGNIFNERKINFISNEVKLIIDTLNKN
ncbi:hypothetical protein AB2T96_00900 [Clostridium butyricum]|uniref:Uncharacterized protein n=2 Tax=Clostridium butyricum TaxID=1492 RepID=A0A2S7F7I1_CLOBU|nr:hypothetical protein [Clostridium butyricum]KHD16152.1 hypothetical protein OA81_05450 [Clostridium butyricum]MBZ0311135.1 hypothetical protein [Clostridium butyricum]MDB2150369.1 hypothetical protein [Clostridium butyricum]PPV13019.1 hypothetical protein AWN73_04475 [Clostridium butyricum]